MASGVRVEGAYRVASKLERIDLNVKLSTRAEMHDIGDDLKNESQRLAPYRPGHSEDEGEGGDNMHLREHAYSDVSKVGPDITELEVGYEGPPGYLLVQHEGGWRNLRAWGRDYGPTQIRNYTTSGTRSKFLEAPWVASLPSNKGRIRGAVRRGLRG